MERPHGETADAAGRPTVGVVEVSYAHLSSPPAQLGVTLPPEHPANSIPIHDPPVNRAETVRVRESGEPMIVVDDHLRCVNAYWLAGWPGTRPETWLRESVVARLVLVQEELPSGFGLAVFDGWRSTETVRALYAHYYGPGSTPAPGFLADPDNLVVTPPHLTGGAVDLTLTWQGTPLSLGTPFDEFTDRAHLRSLEPEGAEPDRSLRRLLWSAMVRADFTPYAEEWWHYSWGDPDWAAARHEPTAPFGITEVRDTG